MFSQVFAFAVAVIVLLINILAVPVAHSLGYMRGLQYTIDVITRIKEANGHEGD